MLAKNSNKMFWKTYHRADGRRSWGSPESRWTCRGDPAVGAVW